MSYNRAFATISHVHRENRDSENVLKVEYNYSKNNNKHIGEGYLISSTDHKLVILDQDIIILEDNDNSVVVNSVKPSATNIRKHIEEIGFFNITLDSLIRLTRNKVISGQIQSSHPVEIIENNIKKKTSLIKLEYAYNFKINIIPDSSKIDMQDKIKLKELQLAKKRQTYNQKLNEIQKLKGRLQYCQDQLTVVTGSYEKNKLQNEIIDLRKKITQKQMNLETYIPDPVLSYEIQLLREKMSNESLLFSGVVRFPVL